MKNASTRLWLAIALVVIGVFAIFSSHHYTYPHGEIVVESNPPIWDRIFGGAVVHEWSVRGDNGYFQGAELLLFAGVVVIIIGAVFFFLESRKRR